MRKYWEYRDELSIENGLILKGERVVISETERGDIIERIHQVHQGVEKCQLRARLCVFGQMSTRTLSLECRSVKFCQKSQNTQAKQTLEPNEVPTRPWQVIETDLFSWNGDEYVASGHSTGQTVVKLQSLCCQNKGFPKSISHNCPRYHCQSYKEFSKEWDFSI